MAHMGYGRKYAHKGPSTQVLWLWVPKTIQNIAFLFKGPLCAVFEQKQPPTLNPDGLRT